MGDINKSIGMKCLAGGMGCGVSGFVCNPCDVIKIRNQQYGGAKYGSFTGTITNILKEEGIFGFYKGAGASVLRELTYSSLRMGLYEPIKDFYLDTLFAGQFAPTSPLIKWCSAFSSGAIGAAIFNPVDVVKVRFQSQLPKDPRPYNGRLYTAFSTIFREKGFTGLYIGTSATVVRAAFLTSAQLGSYDIIKNNLFVQKLGMDKNANQTHLCASMIASVITTTAANPADVVKTRVMNDPDKKVGGAGAWFSHILKNEGPSAFLKGWTAAYLRLGPHTILSLILIERVRGLMGMRGL